MSMYNGRVDRSLLLSHLRRTRFTGDRKRAQADARRIAAYLKREYGARVFGIGSAFNRDLPFRAHSDIDLVVAELPARYFYRASAEAERMTDFGLDIIPLESAVPALRDLVREEAVEL
jgi:predicted nucleotidyltransferase